MQLPILYHKGKNGELRQWRVWTEEDTIFTEYGQVNGQLQITPGKKAEPKNVGKKNETTAEAQADAECQSMWTYKVERKYAETPEEAQEQLPLPMLAKPFYKTDGSITTQGKKVVYPVDVQPKLDGVRCMAQRDGDSVVLTSRQGKVYTVPHISEQLAEWMPEGMILDGELYIHGLSLQRITSLAKKNRPESLALEYHVYDMPTLNGDDTRPWSQRSYDLGEFLICSPNVFQVMSVAASNEQEVLNAHGRCIGDGYEGAIVRHPNGVYLWGYRSNELLKVKKFLDAEFEVIGAKDGRGKFEGLVIWVCRNDLNDETFDCAIIGSMEERAKLYRERDKYMGWKLTVRFFARTDADVPQFPVGIAFRAGEDLPV